jgi:hypothetical protein
MAKAEAVASSVQFSDARLSIARHRSTVAIGARTTFSLTARMWSLSSGSLTRTSISEGRSGYADAPGAIGDGQFAVLVSDGGRLQDADRVDAGGQGRV